MDQSYQDLEAELHDAFWAAEGPAAELVVIADWLRKKPGSALEIGCGSGRLLVPLLQQGFDVEGLEPSAKMLTLCRQRAAAVDLSPTLHLGSMEEHTLGRTYDHVLIPAFTFQLAADPATTLAQWHAQLVTGGWLYVTTFLPLAELEGDLPENTWYEDHAIDLNTNERASLRTRHRLDRAHCLLWREHHYRVDHIQRGLMREHHSQQRIRWFDQGTWLDLLQQAGFHCHDQFADFSPQKRLNRRSQIITTIAQRDS